MKIMVVIMLGFLIFGCTIFNPEENLNESVDVDPQVNISQNTENSEENTNLIEETNFDSKTLDAYLSLKNKLEYTAQYTTVFLDGEQVVTGNIIIYSKKDKYRHDSFIGNEDTIISLFLIPKGNYSCVDAIGNVVCNDLKTSSNPNVYFDNLKDYEILELPSRTVLNKTGNCFMFSNDDETIEQCFLDNGAPIYLRITSSNGIEFTQSLKEIDYTVEDKMFELPN